ncbi:hypothetical protein V1509DRAFT_625766 [Lipomyces kononenkoae]
MVRYTPLYLGVMVVCFTLSTVSGAPAPFYPVVNVDGGSSGAETVQVTEIEPITMLTTSPWGQAAATASCSASFVETVEYTITITASTITSTIGVTSVTTDYQTLTVTEYYTLTSSAEQKASATLSSQKPIMETTVTEYKTLTITSYPNISSTRYVTVTPSSSTNEISTVTITVAASPATITKTISLTSLRTDKTTVTDTYTQYLTGTPERTTPQSPKSESVTPTELEEYTTVTIFQTVKPTVSSAEDITRSSFDSLTPISSESSSAHGHLTTPVSVSESISSSVERATATITGHVSSVGTGTVMVTGVSTSDVETIVPSSSIARSSNADSTITVTQPGATYTLIIDRSVIVTDGYTRYVTDYHTLSPLVGTTSSRGLIETTPHPASPSSPSTSSRDGTDSTTLSSPRSLTFTPFTPFWSNTTTATATTVSTITPITTTTGKMSSEATTEAYPARNWTFFS